MRANIRLAGLHLDYFLNFGEDQPETSINGQKTHRGSVTSVRGSIDINPEPGPDLL